jgi:ankyrin repeat protein
MSSPPASENPTPLLHMPLELLFLVSSFSTSPADVNAFARCNKRLYYSLNASLYRSNMQGSAGSALTWAAENYRSETARIVFEACRDIKLPADYLQKALVMAMTNCSRGVMKLLIANGADANTQGPGLGHILQAASWKGDTGFVQLLLDAGADVNAEAGHYGTALIAAAMYGHENTVNLLIRNHAKVNTQSGSYANALQAASLRGELSIIELLINSKADVNARGGFYGSALQAACWRGNKQVVKALLQAGVDPFMERRDYKNTLSLAVKQRDTSIARMLFTKSFCYFIGRRLPKLLKRNWLNLVPSAASSGN